MPNIFKILSIAQQALAANQFGITVAGHNIANVNTDGFSRQKVTLETSSPNASEAGLIGSGVVATGIERIRDDFLGVRLASEMEVLGEYEQRSQVFQQIEVIFSEGIGTGLNSAVGEFFNAWRFLSSNAALPSARTDLVNSARNMINTFNKMDADLTRLKVDTDTKIVDTVTEVNALTSQIADLNEEIHSIEIGNVSANDLRDTRERLLKELAQRIHIDYFENSSKAVSVITNNGYTLVEGSTSFVLQTSNSSVDTSIHNILWQDQGGNSVIVDSVIGGGELAALLEVRDTDIPNFSDKLGSLAAGIANEVNKIHAAGFGLDGSTGVNFFDLLQVNVTDGILNSGTPTVTGSVVDPSSLMRDDYEITITSSTTFTLQNTTRGAASGTYTFSSGTQVLLPQGLAVTITGTAVTDDIYDVSVNRESARNIMINSVLLNDINKIAASQSGEEDDGSNAQSLADIETSSLMGVSSASSSTYSFSFQDFHASLVSEIGSDSKRAFDNLLQQEGIVNQVENLNEQVSGVSIDEEMINIIKFQRAYEASAKLITLVDGILQTLIETLR